MPKIYLDKRAVAQYSLKKKGSWCAVDLETGGPVRLEVQMEAKVVKSQGEPGAFEYRTVYTIRDAERLQANGWKVLQSSPFTERYQMERRKVGR